MLDEHDHRSIGQRQSLFLFHEDAPGMVFWRPRGLALYRALEDQIRGVARSQGYLEVRTPQLLRRPVWEKSGHWESFAENMFILEEEGRESALKPVSCPGHIQIVDKMSLSHRDLPLRIAELGLCHRNEDSGALHGLFRLRQFTQDDGHIFCTEDQVEAEVGVFIRSLYEVYARFGFRDISVALSTRPAKKMGSDEVWSRAEKLLASSVANMNIDFEVQTGQGAFYGPKLELALRDRLGRSWQCGTIQLDFVLPERFDLRYTDASGARVRPVMLHRAICGSLERFLGVLLEHHQGALPLWLAPEQIVVAPITDAHRAYAEQAVARLSASGVRARLDARSESVGKKVAEAHELGVPYFGVAGAREVASNNLTLRARDGSKREAALDDVIRELNAG
jgi:threonyl-tRNA synthetase